MANAFAVAMGAIFRDANMATAAVYKAGGFGGAAQAVRVLMRAPDVQQTWNESVVSSASLTIEVQVNAVAAPDAGDMFTINGTDYVVQGNPDRDADHLVWAIELVPWQ